MAAPHATVAVALAPMDQMGLGSRARSVPERAAMRGPQRSLTGTAHPSRTGRELISEKAKRSSKQRISRAATGRYPR